MDVTQIAAEADKLEKENRWREAYNYLKEYVDSAEDPELVWRIIRAYYRVGKYLARDKQEREEVARKGEELFARALAINDKNHRLHQVS